MELLTINKIEDAEIMAKTDFLATEMLKRISFKIMIVFFCLVISEEH